MKMVKNVVVLTIITVLAGFLLGYVYDITKEPIENASLKAKQEAYKTVFADASEFVELEGFDSEVVSNTIMAKGFEYNSIDEALVAKSSSGEALGYVFTVSSNEGYGGLITLSMGVKNDGTLNGIEFLTLSETAGLGMNADTPEFKSQFNNMNAASIVYTKAGKSADYEIDAISGATITTNAVTNAVNAGLDYFSTLNGGADNE